MRQLLLLEVSFLKSDSCCRTPGSLDCRTPGNSCCRWRRHKFLIYKGRFFTSSNDLKAGKKSTVRARLRAGGERPAGSWRPPALGTDCGVFVCRRTRGPLWAEWTTPRAFARAAGGGSGEGKPQLSGLWHSQDLLGNRSDSGRPAFPKTVTLAKQPIRPVRAGQIPAFGSVTLPNGISCYSPCYSPCPQWQAGQTG